MGDSLAARPRSDGGRGRRSPGDGRESPVRGERSWPEKPFALSSGQAGVGLETSGQLPAAKARARRSRREALGSAAGPSAAAVVRS
ncbi:unnamed protein product [Rangifer tarandus platyrhynchus]|uniref:Uncharacterized protein n=1 Tax=Rangifer tarandus platyrhynchus TaxID=3082113 RepID=A0ABN8XTX9_RANTA|nr:unnamed protein product [Rangifer tarandus platyrhynchus]